jgi:hypothetical protein
LNFKELSGEQRRQTIDTQQIYDAWRAASRERRSRFAGSMRWGRRNNVEYLLRKTGKAESSLGPRSPETEAAFVAFNSGRAENRDRIAGLSARLDSLAPVNRAMGLGRLPTIAARIIRACDERQLLGEQILIVGTNALFAYEVLAGVHIESGLVASGDIDLLFDARRKLGLAAIQMQTEGLIGLLQEVDKSFAPIRQRAFRASNRDGYLVDFIRPEARDVFRDRLPPAMSNLPNDIEAVAISGLGWLVNSPRIEATAIDERGYPVRMAVIDPRAFALHKSWVSGREDREPLKSKRDMEQAKVAAAIATKYLGKPFDGPELTALPIALRRLAPALLASAETKQARESPSW